MSIPIHLDSTLHGIHLNPANENPHSFFLDKSLVAPPLTIQIFVSCSLLLFSLEFGVFQELFLPSGKSCLSSVLDFVFSQRTFHLILLNFYVLGISLSFGSLMPFFIFQCCF